MKVCAGQRLTVEDICNVAVNSPVSMCQESLQLLSRSRKAYEAGASLGKVYGYSTGLGALASAEEGTWRGREAQVLREHDLGIGPEAPREVVRAAMLVRASQLAQGFAPVRPEVAQRLVDSLNYDIVPAVSLEGSVGASGDLAPLARISRCIYSGEGQATVRGRRLSCGEALEAAGLKPLELGPGEALAIINSNAFSVAMASLGVCASLRLLGESLNVMSETLEVTGCNPQHFSTAVANSKRLEGVKDVVASLKVDCQRSPRLQDPYCIRCVPQVYGSALEVLRFAAKLLEAEAYSSSDNPFVYNDSVYHACNFHASAAGMASDMAKVALAHVGNMIERRTAHLLSSATTGLPDFLAVKGTVVGAMIYQYTAASLAAKLRQLASPGSVHSIPTSGLQEDVVSMAPNSSYELLRSTAVLARLIAVEDALASQASKVARGLPLDDPKDALERSLAKVVGEAGLSGLSFIVNLA
ncbi:histidine ammonia-lyase [Acidilobus saccharovorans 345-15]|uniref:Histidine ammonia-lyase n=1 Tax=Acidilobus saccharovorans (strain DSM 16705 / JCM 18335 / VKM B-2471 / 345-15) TaxID=666510 RepID=D9Q0Z1_ACIS3|nr:aromatic amino acid ammonia-lyase [Acidilobus saccharovorans]ADL18979.1 histidine ammonia-lyase [Acidilobus saccharovorans 345-15]